MNKWLLMIAGMAFMGAMIPVTRRFGKVHKVREIVSVLMAGIIGCYLGISFDSLWYGVTVSAFFAILTAVAFTDADTMEIQDGFHVVIFLIGVISIWTMPGLAITDRLIGIVCVSVPMFLICMAIPGAFGGGDIKLLAASGFLMGWKMLLVATFFGIMLGGAYGAYLLLTKKVDKKEHFAFGPFLCMGMLIAVLWGTQILDAYLGFMAIS